MVVVARSRWSTTSLNSGWRPRIADRFVWPGTKTITGRPACAGGRPQPVGILEGRVGVEGETEAEHAGLLEPMVEVDARRVVKGIRPITAKRSGWAAAAARARSLRSPSQEGGTMTTRSTPAASISPSSSSAPRGTACLRARRAHPPGTPPRLRPPDVHLRGEVMNTRPSSSASRGGYVFTSGAGRRLLSPAGGGSQRQPCLMPGGGLSPPPRPPR